MNRIFQIVFLTVIILILIIAITGQVRINQIKEENEKLSQQVSELKYENDKLRHELENPDIEDKANEQGYYDPDKEYYYSE